MSTQEEIELVLKFKDRQKRYLEDPLAWTREVALFEPTSQQAAVLEAFPHHRFITIKSGNGIGKTRLMATLALYYLTTRPNSKVPCTAPKLTQLHDSLWGELSTLIRSSPFLTHMLEWTHERVYVRGREGEWWAKAITARKDSADQHAVGLQGLHADNLLFLIDEASGISDQVENAIEGAFTGIHTRCVMAGNPTRLSGMFYRSFNEPQEAALWKHFHFSSKDSTNVDDTFIQRLAAKYGEGSPEYAVKVMGDFPEYDSAGLISEHFINEAKARAEIVDKQTLPTEIIGGLDVATSGNASSVLTLRRGAYVFAQLHAPRSVNTEPKLVRWIAQQIRATGLTTLNVDANGIGASVCNLIDQEAGFPAIKLNRVNAGGEPKDVERFYNLRAEAYFYLKELFTSGVLVLDVDIAKYKKQLPILQYMVRDDGTGRLQIESKLKINRRGLPSPDESDALMLAFSNEVGTKHLYTVPSGTIINGLRKGSPLLGTRVADAQKSASLYRVSKFRSFDNGLVRM